MFCFRRCRPPATRANVPSPPSHLTATICHPSPYFLSFWFVTTHPKCSFPSLFSSHVHQAWLVPFCARRRLSWAEAAAMALRRIGDVAAAMTMMAQCTIEKHRISADRENAKPGVIWSHASNILFYCDDKLNCQSAASNTPLAQPIWPCQYSGEWQE